MSLLIHIYIARSCEPKEWPCELYLISSKDELSLPPDALCRGRKPPLTKQFILLLHMLVNEQLINNNLLYCTLILADSY